MSTRRRLRSTRTMILSLALGALASLGGCYFDAFPVGTSVGMVSDADGDGFAAPGDCNDANAKIFPAAGEICDDGIDNDCDGKIDAKDPECEATTTTTSSTSSSGGAGGSGASTSGSGGAGGSGASSTSTASAGGAG